MSSSQDPDARIVITGMGIVSPIGIGVDPFWESLAARRSGIATTELPEHHGAPRNVGGEVTEFTEKTARKEWPKLLRKSIRVMCREIQLGVASALQAVEHAKLETATIDPGRFGVDFGANLMFSPPDVLKDPARACLDEGDPDHDFHYERWGNAGGNTDVKSGMSVMEPLWLLKYLPNMPGCHIGIAVDARGPNNSLVLEEASGNLVVGEAFRILQRGAADVMIAGTTGTRIHPIKATHAVMWDQLAEADDPPETWYRPFDARRMGQVLAEGAGSLILERETSARERGGTIYGTVLGAGSACVVDRQGTAQPRIAMAAAIRAALQDAGLQPEEIGHINAHGLGTTGSDREEAAAIGDVFGEHAANIPVTALKSYFGNAGSGCGVLELAGSVLGLLQGIIPATLNYESPDPDCPLNVVHGEHLSTENRTFLSINVTRRGQAGAVILRAE